MVEMPKVSFENVMPPHQKNGTKAIESKNQNIALVFV
jgi:hypothetical protein